MSQLVQYDAMRSQLAECARVDEAKAIRDKAEALRAYSRQREDREAEGWFEDIKVRAISRIGELSAALPKGSAGGAIGGKRGGTKLPNGEVSKKAALKSAKISEKTAAEAEKVASVVKRNPGKKLRLRDVRQIIKKERRSAREVELAEATKKASVKLGKDLYSVICADPPWRFEPHSRDTGMDRAADNHYPTETVVSLKAIKVPALADCVLFLWATAPMLPQALEVMAAWGFTYRSHCVWLKDKIGTGYWFRNKHELLLVGTKGKVPAPAQGDQYASVIALNATGHSTKPNGFYEMIEDLFPNARGLEMFARKPRVGWDTWGNETKGA